MSYLDLCTVAEVAAWLDQAPSIDATVIQGAITGYSAWLLKSLGRNYLGGFRGYTERYNGNGSGRLQLRNYPVLAVSSLQIGSTVIPATPDFIQQGYAIDTNGEQAAVVLIGGSRDSWGDTGQSPWHQRGWPGVASNGLRFWDGVLNVAVSYTAGTLLEAMGEAQTVPASSPYTVTAANATTFFADLGVANAATGAALTGYTVANGVYILPSTAAGLEVLLAYQYGGVPEDLNQAVTQIVAENYRGRGWIGQASQVQPGVGTTSYRSWAISPINAAIISTYKRTFLD